MPAEKTLDQLRDEKVIPVVRGMLVDMATDLLPEDANVKVDYNQMVMKIMTRVLEADLNIVGENPYAFQLALGVMSGLNKTVQGCDTTPIDDVRYGAIGRQILSIVATANIPMGGAALTPEEEVAVYAPVKEQLNALFKAQNLSMLEVKYIMDQIFDSFNAVQNAFMNGVAQLTSDATARVMGLEFVDDLGMQKLNEVLIETPKVVKGSD